MSAFGPVTLPTMIEDAVLASFQNWMDTYLREFERLTGRDGNGLPPIRSWAAASAGEDKLPEQQPPLVQVTWSHMTVTKHAASLSSIVPFSVEVLVESTDFNAVRDLASLYGFALLMIAVQKLRRESPLIAGITTPQLSIPTVSGAARRWRAVATVDFSVESTAIVTTTGGPDIPYPDPTPVPPDTATVSADGVVVDAELELP